MRALLASLLLAVALAACGTRGTLYTFALNQSGAGTSGDPARFTLQNLTFLYNDPSAQEYDAQLLAPRARPPVIPSTLDRNLDSGVLLAQDVFNRGAADGHRPPGQRAAISSLSVESYSVSVTDLRRSAGPCGDRSWVSVLCATTMSSSDRTVTYCPPAPMPVWAPLNGPGEFGASHTHHRYP